VAAESGVSGPHARPRAVVFDWDNTLVDTWPVIHAALNATLTQFGHAPWTPNETRARVRRSMRDSFPDLFGAQWEDAAAAFYTHFEAVHLDALTVADGAEALLQALDGAGVPMAVVSNKQGRFLRKEAEALGWTPYFKRLVGASDAPRDKPAPDPVLMALDAAGVSASPEVWFVGDADIDIACAHGAGLSGVLVNPDPPHVGTFDASTPDRYCANLTALRAAIDAG
jgi:phosphoglycolate phosphatase